MCQIRDWFSEKLSHYTARRQLGWLTTDMRRMYFSAIIIYKARRIGSYLAKLLNTRRRIDFGRGDTISELELPPWSSQPGYE